MLAMSEPAPARPSLYEQLAELPRHMVGQIIDGELVTQPRPAVPHARFASRLNSIVGPPFDLGHQGPGGWHIIFEPELHLRGDIIVPDIAGWLVGSVPGLLEMVAVDHAPRWICEVLSPSTAKRDRFDKMRIYAREGVDYVWLADPIAGTLEVFTRVNNGWNVQLLEVDDPGLGEIRVAPFDALPLDLRQLWPERAAASPAE